MILTATSRPRRLSRARYTVAMPPCPISSRSSYLSSLGNDCSCAALSQSSAAQLSRQLLHAHAVRSTPNTHARAVDHDVALAGLDEAVVHQELAGVPHLIFHRTGLAHERQRSDAPI